MKNYKKILDKITPYKPGKPIEEVKRELSLERVIKLASNENAIPPSPAVLEAIERTARDVSRYPDGGCFYLRQALSEKLSLSADNIIFGNGSDEIIVLALRAFLDADSEVILANPTFLVYKIASQVEGACIKEIPMNNFRYDLESMLKAVTKKTKVVFIANPDNPTGTYVTDEELKSFIERVGEHVLVVIDEAYYEFAKGGDYPETLELLKREDRNILIIRTFSKAYGLAGLRIGYGLASENIIGVLNKVREPFNVNSIAQAAAIAALKDEKYLLDSVSLVLEEKKKFYNVFKSLGVEYFETKANFVLVNTKRDSEKIFECLLKEGIIVREMSAWGLKGFIRVSIGLSQENEMFFKAFAEAIK
ncbi:MAG: histidinol-phosphate transaminase [Candidatus Omnitrophica bacterium]|nr:histidinol-phosphate transaminase [Candidatus Omnitrophota bacterium]